MLRLPRGYINNHEQSVVRHRAINKVFVEISDENGECVIKN